MPAYYYTREAGDSGQIVAAEGVPRGRRLDEMAEHERPPLRAAIEIGAALADILCIAEEDRVVHGDLVPGSVVVDEKGSVSVSGFGEPRTSTHAPDGRLDATSTDIYGLGVVLHSILCEEPFGDMPADADEHDDVVISRVLAMDFRAVQGRRWVEDVRKFLCNILAWHAEERPLPLDAANVLGSVAEQVPGDGLEEWAKNAGRSVPMLRVVPNDSEMLGGPTSLSAPLARGGVRQAPSSKGESTSFWSREKIAQMLAEEDAEEAEMPMRRAVPDPMPISAREPRDMSRPFPRTGEAGGHAAEARSRGQEPMARGAGSSEDLSPPRRFGGGDEDLAAPRAVAGRPAAPPVVPSARDLGSDSAFPAGGGRNQSPPPPPALPKPVVAPPVDASGSDIARPVEPQPRRVTTAQPSAIRENPGPASPSIQGGYAQPGQVYAPPAEPEPKAGNGLMIGVVAVVVLALACAGVMALGGVGWFWSSGAEVSTDAVPAIPAEAAPAAEDAAAAAVEPATPNDAGAASSGDAAVTSAGGTAVGVPSTTAPASSASTGSAATKSTSTASSSSTAPSTTSAGTSTKSTTTSPSTTSSSKSTSSGSSTSGSSGSSSTASKSSSSTTPAATTTSTSKTTTKSAAAAPTEAPAGGPYTIRFNVPGKEGRIQCGDGQDAEFVGSTNMSFDGTVTCRIKADKKQGVVQLDHAATVTCTDSGTILACGGG